MKKNAGISYFIILASLLGGCKGIPTDYQQDTTSYNSSGAPIYPIKNTIPGTENYLRPAGGFTDKKISYNQYWVSFNANSWSSSARANDLAKLRIAELCLRDGYKHFVIVSENNQFINQGSISVGQYIQLPYGSGIMTSNTQQITNPNSQFYAVAFLNKPVSELEVYNAQGYWNAVSVIYDVIKRPLKGKYNSEDAVDYIMSVVEKLQPDSLEKYEIENEEIKIIRNSIAQYSQSIFYIGLVGNPFLDEKNEKIFLDSLARKYGGNRIEILDYKTEVKINGNDSDWKKRDDEHAIKSNYNLRILRRYNVAVGIRSRAKPYQEEKRIIIRLLESENAKSSGLMIGDEILLVNGKDLEDSSYLFEKKPGDKVKFTIARNGKQVDIDVQLSNPPVE